MRRPVTLHDKLARFKCPTEVVLLMVSVFSATRHVQWQARTQAGTVRAKVHKGGFVTHSSHSLTCGD